MYCILQEQCAQYWPQTTECPQKFGSRLSVEVLSEETHEDYICRELRITDISVRVSLRIPYFTCLHIVYT